MEGPVPVVDPPWSTALDDRIGRVTSEPARHLHNQADDSRHQAVHQLYAVPVYAAVPGRATMNELVAQRVQPLEHVQRVHAADRGVRPCFGLLEALLSVMLGDQPLVGFPDGGKHVRVVDQQPDRARILIPQDAVEEPPCIDLDQAAKQVREVLLFRKRPAVEDLVRTGGVERGPQEDESGIGVGVFLLGALQPAQFPVRAQGQRRRSLQYEYWNDGLPITKTFRSSSQASSGR